MELKLRKVGNATGLILPQQLLAQLGLSEGDTVQVKATADRIEIVRGSTDLTDALEAGRSFRQRYRRTMQDLAK